ncbi:MAG: hypothetical protein RLZZ234_484 [Candidatus Parcubacteria bacterium]|jgi:hypothetical protein
MRRFSYQKRATMDSLPELIANAAVRVEGEVYQAARHFLAMQVALHSGVPPPVRGEEGFTTTTGRFVDRKEAARIAFSGQQIAMPKDELYSEDLFWGK